ncbi:hypothetical protein DUNSADRAFT_13504, partial [Dunaliella salina]
GGPGVAMIGHIAELIETALANKDNLEALLERAAELMDVIIEKHVDQEELASCLEGKIRAPKKAGSRKYCNLMERLQDLLQVARRQLLSRAPLPTALVRSCAFT